MFCADRLTLSSRLIGPYVCVSVGIDVDLGMSKTNDTRERMIAGACTLMRRHGFRATSFKDVWEFTGTPRGSVYFHFPDGKHQLGLDVIDNAVGTLLQWTDRAAARSTDTADFVVALGDQLADFLASTGYDEGCPIAAVAIEMSPSSPALREAANLE
jgi:TetR/AcrR family transcriptional repressor of lmrAB and yxaGH operons